MPLDPSIPLGVKQQPFNNPFSALIAMREGERQRVEDAQRQRLVDQQIRSGEAAEEERRQRTTAAERLAASTATIDGLMQKAMVPDPETGIFTFDRSIAERGIVESGQGHRLPEFMQHFDALDKSTREAAEKNNAAIAKALMTVTASGNTAGSALGMVAYLKKNRLMTDEHAQPILQSLAEDDSPENVAALVKKYGEAIPQYRELLNAEEKRKADLAKTGAETAKLTAETEQIGKPKEPTTLDAAILAARNNPVELNRLLKLAKQEADAKRGPESPRDVGPLETIIGPNGKPIRVPREQAIGKETVAGQEKPSSGVQKRVLNFFNRARQADEELEGFESKIQEQGTAGQAWMKYAPNVIQTQLGQSYTAAQRAFTEARLRKDSGAAIPPQEFENDRQTFFAQPGDTKETLEQKRRARAGILASLAFESGQALGEDLGDPEEAKSVIQKYKDRSSKTAPIRKPIPGISGGEAESTDGGKTWKRVK